MNYTRLSMVGLLTLSLFAVPVLGSGALPVNALVNGDFDHPVIPEPAIEPLQGSALDTCIGIGHQVFYGSDSVQSDLADDNDPEAAAERVTTDPEGTVQSDVVGADSCYFSDENGRDLVWFTPVERMDQPAHWSLDPRNPGVEFGYFYDDDPLDREAIFEPGVGSTHNLWQAYPSPFQAFTANFDALELDIEDGSVPTNAIIRISLSAVPAHVVNDRVVLYQDCVLVFGSGDLVPDANGHVAADPTEASFASAHSSCNDLKQDWDDKPDDRRDVLGKLRVQQFSFWSWNTGDEPVVVDNVEISGATTFAEEALFG